MGVFEKLIILLLIFGILFYLAIYKFHNLYSEKEGSGKPKFDEYQKNIRYKYGYYSFFVLLVLMFIDSFVSSEVVWAEPMVKWFILILVPMLYLTTMTALKGAYIPFNKEKISFKTNIINLLLAVLWLFMGMMQYKRYGIEALIKNGILQTNLIYFVNFFIFIYIAMLTFYIQRKNKE